MLFVLDTDHFSEFDRGSEAGLRLRVRMGRTDAAFFITIITVEEVMQGWLPRIKSCRTAREQIAIYERLQSSVAVLGDWDILPWDEEAVNVYETLKLRKIRTGTMDLKIASIALAYEATVLTRNTVDFAKVPGLRIENWLD